MPALLYVRSELPSHTAAGGVEQATSLNGAFPQVPPLQVLGPEYTRLVVPFAHVFAGVVHETPAHGSPVHAPPEQPLPHVVSEYV